MDMQKTVEVKLSDKIGQLRAIPVQLSKTEKGILCIWSREFDVDPYYNMFYFPEDTIKLTMLSESGSVLWQRDLGRSVVPGVWFMPVISFDLDGDGIDEIYYVGNKNKKHALAINDYVLQQVDAKTGDFVVNWKWPEGSSYSQSLSEAFRNFLVAGYVHGEPVLLTCQGTYSDMRIQAYTKNMTLIWEKAIKKDEPGARGSHMTPVVDFNDDGIDELFWGERCISLEDGRELFCADRDSYKGHSDAINPVRHPITGDWYFYTARESDPSVSPRVVLFDAKGDKVWGDVDSGHMDINWIAKFDPEHFTALSVKIQGKTCGPDGRFRSGREEFAWDLFSGKPITLGFDAYTTLPVDINGDGLHELINMENGQILNGQGEVLASIDGPCGVAMLSHFLDEPGEQLFCYYEDGYIRIWRDKDAVDTPQAQKRYQLPHYQLNQRFYASGYNYTILPGIF